MPNKNIGICKLCLNESQLINSHIIPKFCFKKIKGNDNFYYLLSESKRIKLQKEFREYLLCKQCEDKFSKLETYFSNNIYFYPKKLKLDKNTGVVMTRGFDYPKIKLFLLSILWRGSVSTLPMYKYSKIIAKHEEKIRLLLLNNEPGEENLYGCRIFGLIHEGKINAGFLQNPGWFRMNAHNIIYYTFGGFRFFYFISSHTNQIDKNMFSIRKDGTFRFKLIEMTKIPDILDLFADVIKNENNNNLL